MPGHVGSDAKEMANQLARYSSSFTLTEIKPALGISEKVARGKIRDWTSREHEEHWQSIHGQKAS
jgi:hypothetical protein